MAYVEHSTPGALPSRVSPIQARRPGRADRRPTIDPGPYLGVPGASSVRALTHCPLCLGALAPARGAPGLLRHRRSENDARCVLTTLAWQPAEMVVHHPRDVIASHRQRTRFLEHWEYHLAAMRRLLPSLGVRRFTTVIALADVQGLWSYPSLREPDLPAVLAVLAGFVKVRRAEDEMGQWVRYWFDASVRDVGDLWRPRSVPPQLFRVEYREPETTPFPTGAQVGRWTRVAIEEDAPDGAVTVLEPAERAAFARFVADAAEAPKLWQQ